MNIPTKNRQNLLPLFHYPFKAAIAIGFFSFATSALAQAGYPAKPIKMIVPHAPGGPVDVVARRLGDSLGRRLGQSVIVENRPGANGIIGANACKNAPADGYTFCVFLSDTIVINPSAYKKLQYGPKDFAPVAELTKIDAALVVSSSLPVKNLQEFVSYEATNRGSLNWGHFGIGSSSHLYMTKLNARLGTQLVDIPFQGGAPVVTALLAGEVQAAVLSYSLVSQHIKQGKLRALAVLGERSSSRFPGIPLMKDQGLGDSRQSWIGLFAPAGTSQQLIARMNKEVKAALADPDTNTSLIAQGLTIVGGTPEDVETLVTLEATDWAATVKAANVSLN